MNTLMKTIPCHRVDVIMDPINNEIVSYWNAKLMNQYIALCVNTTL